MQGMDAWACDCQSGWGGPQCQIPVPECTSDEAADECGGAICEHHSSVTFGAAGSRTPTCRCPYGEHYVDGDGCVDRDECELGPPPPCFNGKCLQSSSNLAARTSEEDGVTTVPLGEFRCLCDSGWKGPRCDVRDPVSSVVIVGGVFLFVCVVTALFLLQARCEQRARERKREGKKDYSALEQPRLP